MIGVGILLMWGSVMIFVAGPDEASAMPPLIAFVFGLVLLLAALSDLLAAQ